MRPYAGRVLRRLILMLLLAAFAVPAAAAVPVCHGESAGIAMAHHGMPAAPEKKAVAHVCIGCVPLADWLGARVAMRIAPAPADPLIRVARLDLGGGVQPALPPPRRA